jgi:hypothetical protein
MKRYTKVLGWLEECNTGDVIKAEDFLEYEKKVEATYSRFGDDLVGATRKIRRLEHDTVVLRADLKRASWHRQNVSMEVLKQTAVFKDKEYRLLKSNRVYFTCFVLTTCVAIVALAAL